MNDSDTGALIINGMLIVGALLLLGGEILGILRPGSGDTITEHWRALDTKLSDRPFIRWGYRVFTIGALVWAALHFVAGIS